MCGIAGVIAGENYYDALVRMTESMHHRGPDDSGIVSFTAGAHWVGLGNTRLAILDLSQAGHMPMHDPEAQNWIVHNGEIYNFQELRRELQEEGEKFRSTTDTEVVLKAYGHWGTKSIERFRGMFALAVWDQTRRELFLARDRLGKKPLYYYADPSGAFFFASEVRSLLASGCIRRCLDPLSLEVFLVNGFVISPATMVKGVRSLLPGHWLRVALSGRIIETRRYWQLPSCSGSAETTGELRAEIRNRLQEAVELRLASDVPLGAFLSGGLDSSTIVALMRRAGSAVRTFSIAFDDAAYDESRFARWVADHCRTDHTEVRLTREDFATWLPDALAAMDQPSFDGINAYFVARTARSSGLTVALSGLGGDELFGGYPFFNTVPRLVRVAQSLKSLPRVSFSLLRDWLNRYSRQVAGLWKALEIFCQREEGCGDTGILAAYQTAQTLFPSWVKARMLMDGDDPSSPRSWFGLPPEFLAFIRDEDADKALLERLSGYTLRLFLGERCLRDTDAMSMGVSLEVRAPFTDHPFLESVWKVPAAVRCQGAPDKPFQWDLVQPLLGKRYPLRKKQGFLFPFEDWLRQRSVLDEITEMLANRRLAAAVGLRHEVIADLLSGFVAGRKSLPWSRIWSLFVLFGWCRRHRVHL